MKIGRRTWLRRLKEEGRDKDWVKWQVTLYHSRKKKK